MSSVRGLHWRVVFQRACSCWCLPRCHYGCSMNPKDLRCCWNGATTSHSNSKRPLWLPTPLGCNPTMHKPSTETYRNRRGPSARPATRLHPAGFDSSGRAKARKELMITHRIYKATYRDPLSWLDVACQYHNPPIQRPCPLLPANNATAILKFEPSGRHFVPFA